MDEHDGRHLGEQFSCPTCGIATTPVHGRRALCLSCTEAEIGETLPELRRRVNALILKSRRRKWRV